MNNTKENYFNPKQAKTFTKNLYNISKSNMQLSGFKNDLISPPGTAEQQEIKSKNVSIDFTNKEKLKEFFANKQKVNHRMNSMYRSSINNMNFLNANNTVGQRVLIKNQRGSNVEDRFSKTTKVFY